MSACHTTRWEIEKEMDDPASDAVSSLPPADGLQVFFLPPLTSERTFGLHKERCSPRVESYDAFRQLLVDARAVLGEQLSHELVSRCLGFVPDAVDAAHKTVAV